MKLKKRDNQKIKIQNTTIEEYPIFCFKHLTNNNSHCFRYFKNDVELSRAKVIILDELIKYQHKSWLELGQESKKTGFETISYNQLNFTPNSLDLSNDTKLIIFRINNQNWRLIGYKSDNFKSVLHIIGFDFDYTAYKH